MFKFKASYVALAAVLTSSVVYADPTSYTHSSGATVIDIEKPNAAGVSHNLYRDFNVGANGTILNNSGDDVSHSTFGNTARNNNLTAGSASVILNEVTSKNASSLKGFIEVNGQKADVVIANPNGITCSGCSFVNTNKAILTTGKVNMTDDGAIGSYTVTGGTLTIGENGMNAANGYAVLLADAININGKVQANNALVSAGNFTMDNSSGSVTSAGKKATLIQMTVNPQYSIDVSSLGGIEANSISMVGNNIGFGVRNKGSIVANSSLQLTSNGNLLNKGTIKSNGLLSQVATASGITNDGSIAGAYYLMLSSGDYIVNTGSLSGGQLIATANGNITNGDSGTMTGTSGLSLTSGGKIRNEEKASLLSNNQIAATAIGDFLNEGKISAKPTSLTFLYSDNDPNWEPIALATQSSLNKLGIIVKLEKLANATMRDRVGKGDYDIAIGNWSPDFADPYMFMNYWFESDKKGLPGNRSFYENSEVDKLLRNALATTDQTQRTRDYQQAQKIVIDDAAYVYLFQKNYQLAMNKEVKGFVFNPMLEQVFNINTMSK